MIFFFQILFLEMYVAEPCYMCLQYATHPKDTQKIVALETDLGAKDSEIRALKDQNQTLLSESETLNSERRLYLEKIQVSCI